MDLPLLQKPLQDRGRSQKNRKITPPGQQDHGLPTPPPSAEKLARDAEEIMNQIRAVVSSHSIFSDPQLVEFGVPGHLFLKIQDELDTLTHFDYDPITSKLILRMPTPFHDILAILVQRGIEKELRKVIETDDILVGQQAIEFHHKELEVRGERYPDGLFWHDSSQHPNIIIEVAYSQSGKHLRAAVTDYIKHSKGKTNVAIGIDVTYNKKTQAGTPDKSVFLLIWRSQIDGPSQPGGRRCLRATRTKEEIRNQDGQVVNPEKQLHLTVSDFGPPGVFGELGSTPIAITHQELFEFIVKAEKKHKERRIMHESADTHEGDDDDLDFSGLSGTPNSAVTASDDNWSEKSDTNDEIFDPTSEKDNEMTEDVTSRISRSQSRPDDEFCSLE